MSRDAGREGEKKELRVERVRSIADLVPSSFQARRDWMGFPSSVEEVARESSTSEEEWL